MSEARSTAELLGLRTQPTEPPVPTTEAEEYSAPDASVDFEYLDALARRRRSRPILLR